MCEESPPSPRGEGGLFHSNFSLYHNAVAAFSPGCHRGSTAVTAIMGNNLLDSPYSISMSIWHPELEPDFVTEKFGLVPTSSYRKGEAMKTRLKFLEGTHAGETLNRQSNWIHRFETLADESLDSALRKVLARLEEQQPFIEWITKTEGSIRVTVMLLPLIPCERLFDYRLIAKIRRLCVTFHFTFYPEERYLRLR